MIVGRKREIERLDRMFKSKESEFITIYGRRRVGKTFLVREYFKSKKCTFFHATGAQDSSMQVQLKNFADALSQAFFDDVPLKPPKNWDDAFALLRKQVEKTEGKVVIFLDELPWMVTRRSGLLNQIDYTWNRYWSGMSNVIFIVCGSATSWILKNILYNRGGLHNRTTCEIHVVPFKLYEAKEFLKSRSIELTDSQILSLYLAVGGIPYYLRYAISGLTASENIQKMFFDDNAPLSDEFRKLFDSLFDDAQVYIELIKIIGQKREGASRRYIKSSSKLLTGGGGLTRKLADLTEGGFIEEFLPWGHKRRGEYYRLVDEFCLFYLYWMDRKTSKPYPPNHWLEQSQKPSYTAWSGYVFESICWRHSDEIIRSLGLTTAMEISAWRHGAQDVEDRGAQIDMLIDRSDDAITLCEMKYTKEPFVLNKEYAFALQRKEEVFKKHTKTKKQIFWVLIASDGVKKTMYLEDLITKVVTLKDLFQ